MNRLRSKFILTTLMVGALVVAVPVLAHSHGDRGCGHMSHMGGYGGPAAGVEHMAKRLDLSADQLTSVRSIVDKNRPQLRSLRDQMAANHKQLRALAEDAAQDPGKLRAIADAQGKTIADMIVLRTQMREDIDKVLSDKQREKLHHMHGKDHWEHDED